MICKFIRFLICVVGERREVILLFFCGLSGFWGGCGEAFCCVLSANFDIGQKNKPHGNAAYFSLDEKLSGDILANDADFVA